MKRFLKLSPRAKLLLIEAAALVAAVRVALWVAPFSILKRLMDRLSKEGGERDPARTLAIAEAVRSTSRLVPAASCLTQALAALMLMRRAGLAAELRIGVAHDANGEFLAHAWLEQNGRIILGKLPGHRSYTVLHGPAGANL